MRCFQTHHEMSLSRLRCLCQRGFVVDSDYSGIEAVRDAFVRGASALDDFVASTAGDSNRSMVGSNSLAAGFTFRRTCDINPVVCNILVELNRLHGGDGGSPGSPCHFQDVFHRLTPVQQQYVQGSLPSEAATLEQRLEAMHNLRDWFFANSAWLFPEDAVSWCVCHERECRLLPEPGEDDVSEADPSMLPIRIATAGVTCVAYSGVGAHAGQSHASEAVCWGWLAEQHQRAQQRHGCGSILFIDCAVAWEWAEHLQHISDTYKVMHIFDDPALHGEATHRRRFLGGAYDESEWTWVGPSDYQLDFEDCFQSMSHRFVCSSI